MHPRHLRQNKPSPDPGKGGGLAAFLARLMAYCAFIIMLFAFAIAFGPGLPTALNPMAPLEPEAEPNFLTPIKLARATREPASCLAAIGGISDMRYTTLPDLSHSDLCHVEGQVALRSLSAARLSGVETSCATALRLYMWERHVVQPAALVHFGQPVSSLGDIGSYNCRRINTPEGPGSIMSAHATAAAIDITSVGLADGRELDLRFGWRSADRAERAFWRDIRDGACDWFKTVLSPDFNSLHADHFHLGQDRYGACK